MKVKNFNLELQVYKYQYEELYYIALRGTTIPFNDLLCLTFLDLEPEVFDNYMKTLFNAKYLEKVVINNRLEYLNAPFFESEEIASEAIKWIESQIVLNKLMGDKNDG